MRGRAVVVVAGVAALGLLLGLWILDWWSMTVPQGSVHATLRTIEACNTDVGKCTSASVHGVLPTAILAAGTLLALVTGALAALRVTGAAIAPRLVRAQVMLALLSLAGAVILVSMTPGSLTGAGTAVGAYVAIVAIIVAGGSGIAFLVGDDPLGAGAFYTPVKVDVPPEVVETNVKIAGATIPPFAMQARPRPASTAMETVKAAAAASPTGGTDPPWQPSIRESVHTEAAEPRRRSTRAPYTAPPTFDAARQALRFVVAEAAIGDDGITVTLEDHRKIELAWRVFTRASARQLPAGPPFDKLLVVDLGTIGGAPLRFLPSSRVNYADLPGGAAPSSRENLRRLVAHVKTKQPTFGVEHDSEAFFAGGRDAPALASLKQFMAYDEQYSGVIGSAPPPAA